MNITPIGLLIFSAFVGGIVAWVAWPNDKGISKKEAAVMGAIAGLVLAVIVFGPGPS